jgi:glycosyltransferase involved in cell wall biosynthesis
VHIGVDATSWPNKRGYGRHARGLLSTLVRVDPTNHYTFFLDTEVGVDALPPQAEVRLVRTTLPSVTAASSTGHRSARDVWRMSRAMSARWFDVLLFPTIYTYVPVLGRAKKVVLIHDVIAETYPELTLPGRMARLLWRTKVALGRWQADAVVTVSESSRHLIIERFRLDPEHVHVVSEASDPIFRLLPEPRPTPHLHSLGLGSPTRNIVYVGGFGPHKQVDRLIQAFAVLAARDQNHDLRLVLVGEHRREVFHSSAGQLKQLVRELTISDRVVFTDYLEDGDLVVLLNLSTVLVLPSLMEGFGLPAVEAAACGCPVIATRASPLPAILGDGGVYVDPADPSELERALAQVLESAELRARMRSAGLAAAGQLSWELAAKQMKSVLEKVAA